MKSGLAYVIVLSAIIGAIGHQLPLEPYDWMQQSVSARFNSKAYNGDAVLVAVDEPTLRQLNVTSWKPKFLAELVQTINANDPKRIIIESQNFGSDTIEGRRSLVEALSQTNKIPIVFVPVTPRKMEGVSEPETEAPPKSGPDSESRPADSYRGAETLPASMVVEVSPTGAPANFLYNIDAVQGDFPSIAKLMAGPIEADKNTFNIDLSYSPDTVPQISAKAILNNEFDRRLIEGKKVVISSTNNVLRDTIQTAQGSYVPQATMTILAAQTLIDGPPQMWGWLPAFVLAMIAAFSWIFARPPVGRIIAVVIFLIIFLSPLFLERHLIFQNTSNGILLIALTALGRLWIKFRGALAAYREIAEAKSWFLAQASHDMRQPIHAIGMLSARLTQTDLSAKQAELVAKINSSVDGASRMFQSLLDVATIESGALKPELAPVTVNEILAEIDSQNALAAEQAGVTLRFVPSSLTLLTDRVLAITMLQNIVSNAIKYASGKKVLIGCRRSGNTASLCVYDHGRGISQEDLRHVSEEFYRASKKSSVGADGAGLGLAIVQRLAVLLGVKFSIRSQADRGTGAVISGFPLTTESPTTALGSLTSSPQFLEGLRVCVVDDDLDTLRATEDLLKHWGCIVTAYRDFQKVPDDCEVLVSDFDFGLGRTLADHVDEIRDLEKRGVATIVVTGHDIEKVHQAMQSDSMLALTKPARPAQLRSALMSSKIGKN